MWVVCKSKTGLSQSLPGVDTINYVALLASPLAILASIFLELGLGVHPDGLGLSAEYQGATRPSF